jgi:hypothetical protein
LGSDGEQKNCNFEGKVNAELGIGSDQVAKSTLKRRTLFWLFGKRSREFCQLDKVRIEVVGRKCGVCQENRSRVSE